MKFKVSYECEIEVEDKYPDNVYYYAQNHFRKLGLIAGWDFRERIIVEEVQSSTQTASEKNGV